MSPKLNAAIERARVWLAGLSPEEREAHFEEQKKSWVRGEMGMRAAARLVPPTGGSGAMEPPRCPSLIIFCDCPGPCSQYPGDENAD